MNIFRNHINFYKPQIKQLSVIFILFLNLYCDKNIKTNPHAPTLLWQSSFNNGLSYSIIPVVYNDIVVYSTYDGSDAKFKLVAFNKLTGEKKWEWSNTKYLSGYFIAGFYHLYKNILYLKYVANTDQILIIDLNTGMQIQNVVLPPTYNSDDLIVGKVIGWGKYLVYGVNNFDFTITKLFVYNIETNLINKIYEYRNNFPTQLDFYLYQNIDNQNKLIARIQHAKNALWQIVDSTFDFSYSLDSNKPVFYKKFDANNKQSFFLTVGDKYYYSGTSNRYTQFINEANGDIELNKYQYNNPGGYYKNKLFVFWDTRENSCISADDGYQIWANRDYNFYGGLFFYNDKIYKGNGNMMCVDANTGKLLWSIDTEGGYQDIVTIDPETGYIYTATFTGPVCFKNVP
ncbi:MAG: PQQ-binding-like beta-propeller repeat protein [Alphaproteobacteria bacterium]|nr:PQQ-binding-like beta-propeller repeat protein [Alphaproteobacteria bacterium]